jgi:hypothetical protein
MNHTQQTPQALPAGTFDYDALLASEAFVRNAYNPLPNEAKPYDDAAFVARAKRNVAEYLLQAKAKQA